MKEIHHVQSQQNPPKTEMSAVQQSSSFSTAKPQMKSFVGKDISSWKDPNQDISHSAALRSSNVSIPPHTIPQQPTEQVQVQVNSVTNEEFSQVKKQTESSFKTSQIHSNELMIVDQSEENILEVKAEPVNKIEEIDETASEIKK